MDKFKQQFARIQEQLNGLSATQKMLTASLVVIMAMTFVWWGRYAGNSEMVAIFQQPLSGDDMQNVRRVLLAENIPFEPSGSQIMVPTEKKDYAIAALAYEQVLPKDSAGGFEEIFSKMNPFQSEGTSEKMYNGYIEQNLARTIAYMKGVAIARVKIDSSHDFHIGGNVEPSASIFVQMKQGTPGDKKLAEAIAEIVAGSNARMKRSRVSVIVDGHVFAVRDRDPDAPDGEIAEQQAKAEEIQEKKIKEALRYFQGEVIAVVHAKVDITATRSQTTTISKIQTPAVSIDQKSSNTSMPASGGGEPGAAANTGAVSISQGSAEKGTTETEESHTQLQPFPDQKHEDSTKPAGSTEAVSASVSVPRSYFMNELKSQSHSEKEPAPAEVQALFEQRKDVIVKQVMNAIGISDEKQVSLDTYSDAPLLMAAGSSSSSGGSTSTSPMTIALTGHVREIGVGALALVSLFMVSSMVKKGSPAPVMALEIEETVPAKLGGNIDIAGEVGETDQALDGMELDEDAIKSQQMVEQVSTMVKENPDAAANMVKRWLNQT